MQLLDVLTEMAVSTRKIPKRRFGHQEPVFEEVLHGPDGGDSRGIYKKALRQTKTIEEDIQETKEKREEEKGKARGSDGRVSRKVYKKDLAEIKMCDVEITPKTKKEIRAEKRVVREEVPTSNTPINPGLAAVLKAYNKTTSLVYKIIKFYDDNNLATVYTAAKIRKAIKNNNVNFTNYDRWDLGRSGKYKILEKCRGGYKIRAEIVKFIGLHP